MIENQNSVTQSHGNKNVHEPESRRRSSDGIMGSEEGRVGGLPASRSSLRAFWREPRLCVSRYLVAVARVEGSKIVAGPGTLDGHCWIRD